VHLLSFGKSLEGPTVVEQYFLSKTFPAVRHQNLKSYSPLELQEQGVGWVMMVVGAGIRVRVGCVSSKALGLQSQQDLEDHSSPFYHDRSHGLCSHHGWVLRAGVV